MADQPGGSGFHMTVLGPVGLRARLINSFCFMGRMRTLRAIEYSAQDADLAEQKFGLANAQNEAESSSEASEPEYDDP